MKFVYMVMAVSYICWCLQQAAETFKLPSQKLTGHYSPFSLPKGLLKAALCAWVLLIHLTRWLPLQIRPLGALVMTANDGDLTVFVVVSVDTKYSHKEHKVPLMLHCFGSFLAIFPKSFEVLGIVSQTYHRTDWLSTISKSFKQHLYKSDCVWCLHKHLSLSFCFTQLFLPSLFFLRFPSLQIILMPVYWDAYIHAVCECMCIYSAHE